MSIYIYIYIYISCIYISYIYPIYIYIYISPIYEYIYILLIYIYIYFFFFQEFACKITGMLLEFTPTQLVYLLTHEQVFKDKVNEAAELIASSQDRYLFY